ncbi:MarR family transcriptional regulator [Ochrobactrum sp. Marseille-Q0166]|uniref:MarR family winged helix-turn-helix transcriptional regulator n=1 Tax=Ochrobactrum sp. Marseille-Q0166 TaxID=2761105 RepID=UPI00165553E9|nr:MarR family transcriptional regulator [Ochrobactrum sp. Marseille-Q0166]MBC8716847.1 MarR family transcriptional regulator [Ochrobactrum sp. Marseille-Q0166]
MSKDKKAETLYRLQSVARLTRTVLATRLLELGLYAGQDAVMLQLASEDGLPPGILAQRLGVRPPTVTKTITRLQTQGFVTKKASETDQRQSHVFLTPQGVEAIKIIEKSIRKTEKDMLKGLDKKERKAFLKMLTRLENNLTARGAARMSDALDKEVIEDEDVE